jgi:mRNA-degrading endonuclease RelE of RelBE toxin-antitoxin system
MTYELAIHPEAEREWVKRDESIKKRFKQKLKNERLVNPRLAKDALHGLPETYVTDRCLSKLLILLINFECRRLKPRKIT